MKHTFTHFRHCFVRALFTAALVTLPSIVQAARPTDQIIVKPKPGRDLANVHARAKTSLKKKLKHVDLEVVQVPAGASVDDALAHYGASAEVEYAEPDYILSA